MTGELTNQTQMETHDAGSCGANLDPSLVASVDTNELAERRADVVSAAFAAMVNDLGVQPAPGQS